MNLRIAGAAQNLLLHYSYPGNVRELRNLVESATSYFPMDTIGLKHLPTHFGEPEQEFGPKPDGVLTETVPTSQIDADVPTDISWMEIERRITVDTSVKANGVSEGGGANQERWRDG